MSINYNRVILGGRLSADPEIRFFDNQTCVCNFTLAINRKYKDSEGKQVEDVVFVDCNAWGKQAEAISTYCKKGAALLIEGRLKLDKWQTKDGEKRQRLKVECERFEFGSPSATASERPAASPTKPQTTHQAVASDDDEPPF